MTNGHKGSRGSSGGLDYPHKWVLVKGPDGRPLPGLGITVKTAAAVPTKDGVTTEPFTGYLAMNMPPDMDVIGEDPEYKIFGEHFDLFMAICARDQIEAAAGVASAHWCDGAPLRIPSPYSETASALGTAMRALARRDYHQFTYWIGLAAGTAFGYGLPSFVYERDRVPTFKRSNPVRRRAHAIQAQHLSEGLNANSPDAIGWSAVSRLAARIRAAAENRDSKSLLSVEQSIIQRGWGAFNYDHWPTVVCSTGTSGCMHVGRVGVAPRWHLREGESSKVLTMGLVASCTACGLECGYASSPKNIADVKQHLGFDQAEFPDRVANMIWEESTAIFVTQWQTSRRLSSPFNDMSFLELARAVLRDGADSIRANDRNPLSRGWTGFLDFARSTVTRRGSSARPTNGDSFPLICGFAESIVRGAHFASVCASRNINGTKRPSNRRAPRNRLVKFVAPGTLACQIVDAYSSRNVDQCLELLRRCYRFATWELNSFRRLN